MGRKSLKEGQQKKIIQAFYEIARAEGIENVSFGKIAKELNMHQSLVVHYFSSKEEMLLGLIDFIVTSYQNVYEPQEQYEDPLIKLKVVLENIFSRKWNTYVDDSIFYNCFALIFRNEKILEHFRDLHVLLRKWLEKLIQNCIDQKLINNQDAEEAADIIFVISDGAYYYLSMIADQDLYHKHLERYKSEAFKVLGISL
ncbi:TetR family transcriptional regulator [Pedobacter agri]|uniref:TetR family transcriptional regulator n=1 Tax=Pedobacter agri TaxID=454586 RepID=UPI00292D6363|nr:TetR family transcriptional regulator [Pedobacter agri]